MLDEKILKAQHYAASLCESLMDAHSCVANRPEPQQGRSIADKATTAYFLELLTQARALGSKLASL